MSLCTVSLEGPFRVLLRPFFGYYGQYLGTMSLCVSNMRPDDQILCSKICHLDLFVCQQCTTRRPDPVFKDLSPWSLCMSKHTRGENERYLIWTRQNHVQILGKFCLQQSDERTNRYKLLALVISKLDLLWGRERLKNWKTIFKSDITKSKISVYHILCFISVCPFVALSKAKFAQNVHIVLSSP